MRFTGRIETLRAFSRTIAFIVGFALLLAGCSQGGGGGGGTATGGGAPPAEPQFVFVANGDGGAITRFRVDAASGNLVHDGYQVIATAALEDVAVQPAGAFLFAVSGTTLFAFAIDPQTGRLSPINDRTTGGGPAEIVLHPTLPVVYVSSRSGDSISAFGVDPATGALSTLSSVPSNDPVDICLDPAAHQMYAVNHDQRTVSRHRLEANGTLGVAVVVHTETQFETTGVAFHPVGDRAYVTINAQTANVRTFQVDAMSGSLALFDTDAAGSYPSEIQLDALGEFAYVANDGNSSVTVFGVDAMIGTLTFQSSTPVVAQPSCLRFAPDGWTLYVGSSADAEIDVLQIAPDGDLSELDRIRSRGQIRGFAIRPGVGVAPPPAVDQVFIPHPLDDKIYRFDRDGATGNLTNRWEVQAGDYPYNVVFHPSGDFAYAVSGESADIELFSVDRTTGNLASAQVVSVLPQIIPSDGTDLLIRLAIDPSGRFLYALDNRTDFGLSGRIFQYTIAASGMLTYAGTDTTGWNPENFVISPTGKYLYVMCSWGDQIQTFEIDASTGDLTLKQTFGGVDRPLQAEIHPNGRWMYVAAQNENRVYKFFLQASNGFLTNGQSYQKPAPAQTYHTAVHPGGDFVYVSSADATVAKFQINRVTGGLTYVNEVGGPGSFWLELTDDGRHAYSVSLNGVVRFAIDPETLNLSVAGTTELLQLGSYQRSLTVK